MIADLWKRAQNKMQNNIYKCYAEHTLKYLPWSHYIFIQGK